jgi:putative peptide-modifying radical SAM enzyme
MEDTDEDFSGFEIDYSLPRKINCSLDLLDQFCRQDPDCVLTFYGGEPLLCIDEIKQIMDKVKAKHFMIQTNGLLLDRLDSEYLNRFHTVLVSIDGEEATTDFNRGKGTFRKVTDNLRMIVENGFRGELIARMTVMEPIDIYKEVTWLLSNSEFSFSSIHWQLNAGFWKTDFERRDFKRWSEESYNPGIRRLVEFWVDRMEEDKSVLRLYPILGVAQSLLCGEERTLLRCGGGWANYAIQTDGHVVPCPAMWGMKDYYLGHISSADPRRLPKVFVKGECAKCEILNVCGGRCLYANVTKRWGLEAYSQVCGTVKNLVQAVTEQMPLIRQLVERGKIGMRDFEYMKYNGCEIIP